MEFLGYLVLIAGCAVLAVIFAFPAMQLARAEAMEAALTPDMLRDAQAV